MTFIIYSKKYGKHVVEIDDEDWPQVKNYTWHVHYETHPLRLAAVITNVYENGKHTTEKLHRILTRYDTTDHIDGNPLNNRRSNLRPCTPAQNAHNGKMRNTNTSGYKGVKYFRSKGRSYIGASIGVNNKRIFLGVFSTLEDAAQAYNEAAIKYHGEFARLNEL